MFTLDFGEWLDMREFLGIEPRSSRREDLEEYLVFGLWSLSAHETIR
jgi:hypothetical protein